MFNISNALSFLYSEDFINRTIQTELLEFYDSDNTQETRDEIERKLPKNKVLSSLYSFHVVSGYDLNPKEDVDKRRINTLIYYRITPFSEWKKYIFTLQCYPWAKHLSQIVEDSEKLAAASVSYRNVLEDNKK